MSKGTGVTTKARIAAIEEGDLYFSPQVLVNMLKKVIEKTVPDPGIVLYDPASADGRLLKPFEETRPVFNSDINPLSENVKLIDFIHPEKTKDLNNGKTNLSDVKEHLLEDYRPKIAKNRKMALVFNPPFSLTTSKNGVIAFLEKANMMMRDGEYAIVIAPQTASNMNNLLRIPKSLHLKKEYYVWKGVTFRKPLTYPRKNNTCSNDNDCVKLCKSLKQKQCKDKKCMTKQGGHKNDSGQCFENKNVNIIIQVWRKDSRSDFAAGITVNTFKVDKKLRETLPFETATSQGNKTRIPDFFLLRKGSGKDVGMVLDHRSAQKIMQLSDDDDFGIFGSKPRKGRRTCKDQCIRTSPSIAPVHDRVGITKKGSDELLFCGSFDKAKAWLKPPKKKKGEQKTPKRPKKDCKKWERASDKDVVKMKNLELGKFQAKYKELQGVIRQLGLANTFELHAIRQSSWYCQEKRSKSACKSPCMWKQTCGFVSEYVPKDITYSQKVAASLLPIWVKQGRSKEEVKRKFHEVYTRDVYTRFLGYHTEKPQTISPQVASYMYKNHKRVPLREELGIKASVEGTPEEKDLFERRREHFISINEMYDMSTLRGGMIRGMKDLVKRHEALTDRRDVGLRRYFNTLLNSKR